LNEIRTNRSQYKIRNENNVVAASSRDNLSQGGASSMESFNTERIQGKQIKKKSKTLVLKEERRFETTESMLERLFGKEIKENKPELMLPSLLLAKTKTPANGNVKKEPLKKIELKKNVEMKAKSMIPSKDSAAMFVENRSYFRKLKAEEDEEKYLQFHNTMDSKFVEMREKLNLLKNAINK